MEGVMALINMTEIIVRQRLEELLKNYDCCKCEQCFYDMMAYALNSLKPQYVNSHEGELYSKLNCSNIQRMVDIDIAVTKAINTVSKSPHHGYVISNDLK
jgi:competence protein ComFB